MESETGPYDGLSSGSGVCLENDFESLSAPSTDEVQAGPSPPSRPEQNDWRTAPSVGGGDFPGTEATDPDQLISFDSIEDVPRQPEAHPPPIWSPPTSTTTDAVGPSEHGVSKTDDGKPSSSCAPCCSFVKNIDPRVLDLIYWHDLKKSGVVFGSILVLLLSLALFSVLSVVAYLSLVTLTISLSFRLYKNVMSAVQKSGEGHPYKQYLEMDLSISEAKVHEVADLVAKHVTGFMTELRRLFLVEEMVDSLKFALFLWVLTYIGSWFNGMTLIIIGLVAVFTLPKVYDTYKVQIDDHLELARSKIKAVWKLVQEKIPLPGKKKPE